MEHVRDLLCIVAICGVAATLGVTSAGGETLEEGLAALRDGFDTMSLRKLQDAVRIFRARASGADEDGADHHHLARALEGMAIHHVNEGNKDAAVRLLQDAIAAVTGALRRNDRASAYHATLGDLYGQLAGQSGVIGKMRYGRLAGSEYARALTLDPRNALAHVGAGIGKLETPPMFGGSATDALREFRTAQQLDPSCDEAWIWEGIAHRRQGDVARARDAFRAALTVNPRSDHARRELASLEEDFR